jgi:serine/threonine protein kinase
VIEVYDYGLTETGPFFTMELLDGGDLADRSPIAWREACALLYDVCSSLALLHSRRFVHRDVSPRNVRCTRNGQAKLFDFGTMAPMGVAKDVAGTPPYMAPEAVHGQALDARTDITTQMLSDEGYTVTVPADENGEEQELVFVKRDYERKFFSDETNLSFVSCFLDNAKSDPLTGEVKKSVHLKYPNYSGTLSTAGGLVFLALLDGTIAAFDESTLDELWKVNVGAGFSAPPMTFEVNGKQYIAIASGSSTASRAKLVNTPELRDQRQATMLYVFGL